VKDLGDHIPLLIPEPLFLELFEKRVDVGEIPIGVKGVSKETLNTINALVRSICSVDINENVFVDAKILHQVEVFINFDIREHFTDLDKILKISFNLNEAFIISIDQQDDNQIAQIYIYAGNDAAVKHALITLVQLINQYGTLIPSMVIRDMPIFQNRGFLLDISRDRVPKMEELMSLVNTLAFLKYNHLQLYTEHTFAYKGHETVWKNASPLTPAEIQAIDVHCQLLGITLAANQACFTHFTRWLEHKPYSELAEIISEWEWEGNSFLGPYSLSPKIPGSISLVSDMLGQLLPNFSSGLVNINCDEAIDLGKGAAKDLVDERGTYTVYWDFVNIIMDIVRDHNFRPMFWADMWLKAPKKYRMMLDKDVISLVWGYEPGTQFAQACIALNAHQTEVWVCPGTSCWRSITGRTDERRMNLNEAAVQGLENGAKGFLLTEWGDSGHRQLYPITLFALAEAAQSAWSASNLDTSCKAISLQIFGDRKKLEIGKWLAALGNVDVDLRQNATRIKDNGLEVPLINASCLFAEMDGQINDEIKSGTLTEWSRVETGLVNLIDDFMPLSDEQFNVEVKHIIKVTKFAIQKAILRRDSASKQKQGISKLIDLMKDIIDEHKVLWLRRSRIGGLDDSCQHYEKIIADLVNYAKSISL